MASRVAGSHDSDAKVDADQGPMMLNVRVKTIHSIANET